MVLRFYTINPKYITIVTNAEEAGYISLHLKIS